MRLYLVPNKQMLDKDGEVDAAEIFSGVNILQSYWYCDDFTEQVIIPNCGDFMLDSGAFSFMTSAKGKKVDWEEYARKYAAFVVKNGIQKYFEIDIDARVGYEKVKELRRRVEAATGRPCIPVWHKSRGFDEYLRLCDQYDYVAIGGIVSGEIKRNEYRAFPRLIQEAHKRGAKVHGLGFTSLDGLRKYHFDSVDSSSWSAGNRFGMLFEFNGKTMVQHDRKDGTKIADHQKLSLHNFTEWVKFQRYAETHL